MVAGDHSHGTERAPFIAAVIRVQRRRLERNTASGLWNRAGDTSYHVSNAVFSAHAAGAAIRAHSGIENRRHYPRDVTMGEDACRVRKNPGVLARIRSFAANIMRANNVTNLARAIEMP
jgi:predicted transposase YbfD/YdcC